MNARPSRGPARRSTRGLGALMIGCALAVLVSTPAAAETLPGSSVDADYECQGADDASAGVLAALGDGPLTFTPRLELGEISPAPAAGESFDAVFTGGLDLDAALVEGVIGMGITEATVSDLSLTISAAGGATGDDLVATPPSQTFQLSPGQAVSLALGPFTHSFSRGEDPADAISFTPGPLAMTLSVMLGNSPVDLRVACTTSGALLSTGAAVLSAEVVAEPTAAPEADDGTLAHTGPLALGLLAAAGLLLVNIGWLVRSTLPRFRG